MTVTRNLSLLHRVARYIVDNYRPAKEWNRHDLLRWLDWNLSEGFVITAQEAPGTPIIGLMIARPVMEIMDGKVDCKFDPEGKYIYVDLIIISRAEARKLLFLVGLRRFGYRAGTIWNNYKHRRQVAVPLSRLLDRVLGKVIL